MRPIDRLQFIHRLTGADFHPRRSSWLVPLLGAVALAIVTGIVWN
ncbi:hypothetical protein [Pantoea sp. BAV 3049]|nr:hypothetical protein [Pantoea sp. BAV 3049]